MIAALGSSLACARDAAAGEKQSINAFAVYESNGQVYRTGEQSATFVGAITGPFFVETPEGPAGPASIVCPAKVEVDLHDGAQDGEGHCTITAKDGGQVFAKWTCQGYALVGCRGKFELTGGTDRFQGITGGGTMIVRSDLQEIAKTAESAGVSKISSGIVVWRPLEYEIP